MNVKTSCDRHRHVVALVNAGSRSSLLRHVHHYWVTLSRLSLHVTFITGKSSCCDHHGTSRSCAHHCTSRSCAQHCTSRSCAQYCPSRSCAQHCTSRCCLPSRSDHHVVAVVPLWPFGGAIVTAGVRGWLCMMDDMKQKQSGAVSVCNRV